MSHESQTPACQISTCRTPLPGPLRFEIAKKKTSNCREAAVKSKITDHNKDKGHLMVPCGLDTLKDIGQPPADASDAMGKQPIELWKSAFESYFGASPPLTAGVGAVPDLDPEGQFAEKDVDETRAQKEEELSLFRQVLVPCLPLLPLKLLRKGGGLIVSFSGGERNPSFGPLFVKGFSQREEEKRRGREERVGGT